MDLSLILREAPCKVDLLDFSDSLLLLEHHYDVEHEKAKFTSALHSMDLK